MRFYSNKRTPASGGSHWFRCDSVCVLYAGVDIWVAGGYPGGGPHAHEEGLLRCRLAQQPRHPVRLSRHEGEPAVALQKGWCVDHSVEAMF